jgi:hypothetical protein
MAETAEGNRFVARKSRDLARKKMRSARVVRRASGGKRKKVGKQASYILEVHPVLTRRESE